MPSQSAAHRARLEIVYHRREHSSLQTTPLLRWQRDADHIPDSGIGYSQVLPILVRDLLADEGSTVFVSSNPSCT